MEQISNKTLTFLLIAAIVVSIGGTIISINRLNQLIPKLTGLATTTGIVNISLANVNSITIPDGTINFGTCSPNASSGSNLSSNISNGTTWESWGSPGVCSLFTNNPDNITIRNDGNTHANLSVKTNVLASGFIGGADPYGPHMWFSVRNASDYPGCLNATLDDYQLDSDFDTDTGMQWDWKNFTTADENYLACANLTPTENYNSVYVFIKIFLPADTPQATGKNATLTFTATNW